MNYSHLTALRRNKVSAPSKILFNEGVAPYGSTVLDYGCGYGFDANTYGWDKYDPGFSLEMQYHSYRVIVCNYVLNVVDVRTADDIINHIKSLIHYTKGMAYITVRNDIKGLIKSARGTMLHDVIEDTDWISLKDLAVKFPKNVVAAIDAITHRKNEPLEDYWSRVKNDQLALVVKLMDIQHNSSNDRLNVLDPITKARLINKYNRAKEFLLK